MGAAEKNIAVGINSEIGNLQKVIIHSPGREIQDMTPKMAEQLLYNDIIPLSVVSREHENFKKILQRVSEVYEYSDLLKEVLEDEERKQEFLDRVVTENGIEERRSELYDMSAAELSDTLITGLPRRKNSLEKYLSDKVYDINPLPNLYFARDAAMVYGSGVISGCMANTVRRAEAEIAAAAFATLSKLENSGFLFDGHNHTGVDGLSIEGGDFLVLSKNCLLIGCSERTSASAIDAVSRRISAGLSDGRRATVFAVILPHERATIHLDMILTQLDRGELMVYEPYLCGNRKLEFIRIDIAEGRDPVLTGVPDLLKALREEGFDMKPIFCGNADPIQQQREQWLSGNNFFAIAPGKVIGYACNNYTMEALHRAGYEIKLDKDFLDGGESIDRYRKLVIGISGVELARGGGGARCMTLPVKRMEI